MAGDARLNWGRVIVAIIAAEALPVLALIAIVIVYSFVRPADSPSPEEFAPAAGMWVGPIGGFLAVLIFALWAGKHSPQRPLVHGAAVGMGTALLDFGLALLLGGGESAPLVLILSNAGRILAGVLGGWLASRGGASWQV